MPLRVDLPPIVPCPPQRWAERPGAWAQVNPPLKQIPNCTGLRARNNELVIGIGADADFLKDRFGCGVAHRDGLAASQACRKHGKLGRHPVERNFKDHRIRRFGVCHFKVAFAVGYGH